MKNLFTTLFLLFSLTSFSQSVTIQGGDFSLEQAAELLKEKNIDLDQLTRNGNNIILGEVSGGGKSLPFASVNILMTEQEAILEKEIISAHFKGKKVLGKLDSIDIQGKTIFSDEIKGVVYK